MVFHPQYNGASNQTLFVATDGGIFRTDNARASTLLGAIGATGPGNPTNSAGAWTPLNNSYAVTQFYAARRILLRSRSRLILQPLPS
ncbi:MAG: hypothetical protein HY269_05295 [Deltaproteobacteria bacterium]|nr:hypothetical protein [Deltaproteobacteria bacterium]